MTKNYGKFVFPVTWKTFEARVCFKLYRCSCASPIQSQKQFSPCIMNQSMCSHIAVRPLLATQLLTIPLDLPSGLFYFHHLSLLGMDTLGVGRTFSIFP